MRDKVHGMIHCSGGARTKIMNFVSNKLVVKDNMFAPGPLFTLIQKQSGTDWREMYKVFNMGHRFEIYLPAQDAAEVIRISESFGIPAQIVGHVEDAPANRLIIKSQFGTFEY